jgi:hypothetical protein
MPQPCASPVFPHALAGSWTCTRSGPQQRLAGRGRRCLDSGRATPRQQHPGEQAAAGGFRCQQADGPTVRAAFSLTIRDSLGFRYLGRRAHDEAVDCFDGVGLAGLTSADTQPERASQSEHAVRQFPLDLIALQLLQHSPLLMLRHWWRQRERLENAWRPHDRANNPTSNPHECPTSMSPHGRAAGRSHRPRGAA